MGSEVDLSCSESSADFSEDLDTPEVSAQPQDSLILEFRRVDPEDARVELDRLRLVETASMAPAGYLQATEAFQRERSMIVDSICGVRADASLLWSWLTTRDIASRLQALYAHEKDSLSAYICSVVLSLSLLPRKMRLTLGSYVGRGET